MVPSWIAGAAAALGDAGLRQRLGDLQALAFERIGRDHVDLAEAGDAGRDRGEVVDVAAEADVGEHLAAELGEGLVEHLGVADAGIGVLVEQHGGARVEPVVGVGRDVDALHHLVRHDAEGPGIAGLGDLDRRTSRR